MIIVGDKKFIPAPFDNEAEIERVVLTHGEYIFGPDSIMLPKSLIRSADGSGTIPDGFAVDFASRRWFVVEAELGSHSVWGHIAPQVWKQVVAAQQPATRKLLIELTTDMIREDDDQKDRINELGIPEIEIHRVLTEIFESAPIVGIPIDSISTDLKEWALSLKIEVRLWVVRKLVDFNDPGVVLYEIPDEHRPVFDTTENAAETESTAFYDVSLLDLIHNGLLKSGDVLSMSYGPRGEDRLTYSTAVNDDGELVADGQHYSSPSYAALYFIQKAGSTRNTVNGWTSWRAPDGRLLSELRQEYLETEHDSEQNIPH